MSSLTSAEAPERIRDFSRTEEKCDLAAILLLGLAARLWHIRHGLPDFTEEAPLFRTALSMWAVPGQAVDLNPHSFTYPALGIYLQMAVQWLVRVGQLVTHRIDQPGDYLLATLTDPTPSVVACRLVGVAADLVAMFCAFRIARRAGVVPGLLAAAAVACSRSAIATSRLVYSDSLMTGLSMLALERTLIYGETGRWRHLVQAAAAAGMATSAKYPAVALFIPLLVAIARRSERRRLFMAAGAVGTGLAVFAATNPALILDRHQVWLDLETLRHVIGGGGLGHVSGPSAPYYVKLLVANQGFLGIGLMLLSLRRVRQQPVALLSLAFAAFFLPIVAAPVEAERYVIPSVTVGAALMGFGVSALPKLPRGFELALILVTVAGFLGPGYGAAMQGEGSTQIEARRWLQSRAESNDIILSEAYGPLLTTRGGAEQIEASRAFLGASARTRAMYSSLPRYRMVWLPLVVSGDTRLVASGSPVDLPIYSHAVDWNAAVYDVRLLRGVRYVVTTDAVRGRFGRDPKRFREQSTFYAFLGQFADTAITFRSTRRNEGPEIVVYRLGERAREQLDRSGEVGPAWWARTLPSAHRDRVTAWLESSGSDGEIDPQGLALRGAYAQRYGPFVDDVVAELMEVGRFGEAAALSRGPAVMFPEDRQRVLRYLVSATRARRFTDMLPIARRALATEPSPEGRRVLSTLLAAAEIGSSRTAR